MLANGEVDAAISARTPDVFLDRHPQVVRLFPNYRAEELTYAQDCVASPPAGVEDVRRGPRMLREDRAAHGDKMHDREHAGLLVARRPVPAGTAVDVAVVSAGTLRYRNFRAGWSTLLPPSVPTNAHASVREADMDHDLTLT